MQMAQFIRALTRSDARLVGRDQFPLFMFGFIVYIATVLRFLLPWLNAYLAERSILPNAMIAQSLSDFYPLIVAYMVMFTGGSIIGTIQGFMMIDEKDQNTLIAMLVTPVPLNRYVLYRVALPLVLAFFIVIGMLLVVNQALLPLWQLMMISAGAALIAPIMTLFYAITAENKIQGFAYAKFAGSAGWIIMLGWFVPAPWQWLFGLFPPFWISKAYWMALDGNAWWWLALITGIVLQIGLIAWMAKFFSRRVYRE